MKREMLVDLGNALFGKLVNQGLKVFEYSPELPINEYQLTNYQLTNCFILSSIRNNT
jgi:hypothetical protein